MSGEDDRYRKWVKTQPCCMCGAPPPSDPHHEPRRHGGKRAHDHTCIPLGRANCTCHDDGQHPATLKGRFEGWTREQYDRWHKRMAEKYLAQWMAMKPKRRRCPALAGEAVF